jgi:hypothetical protein
MPLHVNEGWNSNFTVDELAGGSVVVVVVDGSIDVEVDASMVVDVVVVDGVVAGGT